MTTSTCNMQYSIGRCERPLCKQDLSRADLHSRNVTTDYRDNDLPKKHCAHQSSTMSRNLRAAALHWRAPYPMPTGGRNLQFMFRESPHDCPLPGGWLADERTRKPTPPLSSSCGNIGAGCSGLGMRPAVLTTTPNTSCHSS